MILDVKFKYITLIYTNEYYYDSSGIILKKKYDLFELKLGWIEPAFRFYGDLNNLLMIEVAQ